METERRRKYDNSKIREVRSFTTVALVIRVPVAEASKKSKETEKKPLKRHVNWC